MHFTVRCVPQGSNRSQFLSLVSLDTSPALMCHGHALTLADAQDKVRLRSHARRRSG